MFSKGRDFGAWLGLVPKHGISTGRPHASSAKSPGAAIATCAFCSCRRHGLCWSRIKNWERYGLKSWIEAAKRRLHHNVLAIALANKLARIAWAGAG